MGVVYRFYINPFYHVTKIAMDFTAYRRISPNDYRDFPILLEQKRYYFGFQCTKLNLQCKFITHETYPFDGYKIPEKSVRDIWLSTDEIKAIRDVKVSRENRIRKYLRNLYMFTHFIYLIFFYYFCSK